MFRDGNVIDYVCRGFGGNHNKSFVRNSKSDAYIKDAYDIKKEINAIKLRIHYLEKNKNLTKSQLKELLSYRNDLAFWQTEMSKFDNLPSHKRLKSSKKKINPIKLKELVINLINEAISNDTYFLYKEDVAYRLQVRVKDLDKIFMELNREGKLSQAKHGFMHDSVRGYEPLLPGERSDWRGDVYYIR